MNIHEHDQADPLDPYEREVNRLIDENAAMKALLAEIKPKVCLSPIETAPSFESVLVYNGDRLAFGENAIFAVAIKSEHPTDGDIWACRFGKVRPTHWTRLPNTNIEDVNRIDAFLVGYETSPKSS